jgi:hypothetical protein
LAANQGIRDKEEVVIGRPICVGHRLSPSTSFFSFYIYWAATDKRYKKLRSGPVNKKRRKWKGFPFSRIRPTHNISELCVADEGKQENVRE